MFVNSWSLADFFGEAQTELINVDEVLINFGNVVQYFWQLWMKELFPERNIKIELGDNIMGEAGLPGIMIQAKLGGVTIPRREGFCTSCIVVLR